MIRLATPEPLASDAVRNAEKAVLGSMLRDNACIPDVLDIIKRDFFTTLHHANIYSAIISLWDAAKPADLVTVHELLETQDKLDVDGASKDRTALDLAELWDAAPTAASATYYARIMRERAIFRALASAGSEIIYDSAHPTGDAESTLENAEKNIFAIGEMGVEGQLYELRDLVYPALNQFDAAASGKGPRGLPTGFLDLDELTSGMHPSELIIVGARPSVGKTALGLTIANNVRKAGVSVFFSSLEQSRQELTMRLLCMEAGVNSHRIRSGYLSGEDAQRLADSVPGLREGKLHIDDTPRQGMMRIADRKSVV